MCATPIKAVKVCSRSQWLESRSFHLCVPRNKAEDRKEMLASLPAKDEGTDGERAVDIDSIIKSREDMFPDERTPNVLFSGIPFKDLPICNIRSSPNNTIFTITDHKGVVHLTRSCGVEGFKNTRKGTNIAAQATAISLSSVSLRTFIKSFDLVLQGMGYGGFSSLSNISNAGIRISGITEKTRLVSGERRSRDPRKL
ncbi:hypothetical protein PR048_020641 [Dryococelus australis]|uniref:Ribosomal protein S11 n=1 Tax=Dryococelus australis TaxID=614101 RepID=A0ABQ9H6W6_9NEOP|nr:hypothetical protein PR048_020641 [Dryococelus australis]